MNKGSTYHRQGVLYFMGRGLEIPWIGGVWVQNTMGRGFEIPLVGVQYTMDRGFDMPWVGGSTYSG